MSHAGTAARNDHDAAKNLSVPVIAVKAVTIISNDIVGGRTRSSCPLPDAAAVNPAAKSSSAAASDMFSL